MSKITDLTALVKQPIAFVYVSNTVVNLRFASGDRLVITPRGDGSSQIDTHFADEKDSFTALVVGRNSKRIEIDLRLEDALPEVDDAIYPRRDWQYEVSNGDTLLGDSEWLQHCRERDAGDGTLPKVRRRA